MPEGSFSGPATAAEQDRFHQRLAAFNQKRFEPALPHEGWRGDVDETCEMLRVEGEYLEAARRAVAGSRRRATTSPSTTPSTSATTPAPQTAPPIRGTPDEVPLPRIVAFTPAPAPWRTACGN